MGHLVPRHMNQNLWDNLCVFFLKCLIIFERERERAQVGEGHRERETQNPKQAPGSKLLA